MQISIYEEFPESGLEKLSYIDFPARIMVACKNLDEFHNYQKQILDSNSHITAVGYWPVLKKEEGYWFSPFADGKAVQRVISELKERKLDDRLILKWDVELPLNRRMSCIFADGEVFEKNKQRINNFLEQAAYYNIDLITVETGSPIPFKEHFGLEFNPKIYDNDVIKMAYTSFVKSNRLRFLPFSSRLFGRKKLENVVTYGKKKFKDRFGIALGCLDIGILGWEPVMTPQELFEDLHYVNTRDIDKVYLFRLEGFNTNIANIVRQYAE